MKRILLILLITVSLFTQAQVPYVELEVPAKGERCGMIVVRPDSLLPGVQYPLIIFLHGIGERGDGTDKGLDRLRTNGSVASLEANAKKYGFILIEPQAKNNWEHGETEEAYQWAKDSLYEHINWKKVYITGLSLGGGGVQRYLSINPEAWKLFAAAAIMCPGPNYFFVAEKNYPTLINTKVPIWFFHNKGDSVAQTYRSTLLTKKRWEEARGTAKFAFTIYNFSGHTWPAYNRGTGSKAALPTEATMLNNPAVNVYEWFLQNEIGKPPVMPHVLYVPPPRPIPTKPTTDTIILIDTTVIVKPDTTKVIVTLIGVGTYPDFQIKNSQVVECIWSNGVKTVYRAKPGDSMTPYISFRTKSVTLDYRIAPTEVIGPLKK